MQFSASFSDPADAVTLSCCSYPVIPADAVTLSCCSYPVIIALHLSLHLSQPLVITEELLKPITLTTITSEDKAGDSNENSSW